MRLVLTQLSVSEPVRYLYKTISRGCTCSQISHGIANKAANEAGEVVAISQNTYQMRAFDLG